MSNPYQLVVFDWEGTIADTLGQVLNTVSQEADKLGLGKVDPYLAKKYVSLGLEEALRKLFPNTSSLEQGQLIQAVQLSMVSQPTELCLIPGVLEFIKQLQHAGMDLGIATNKGHYSLVRALQATGLDDIFKVTRSAGQVAAKPCPQMLEEIMVEFNKDSSNTLMIGDSVSDMEMASCIQVDAIAVDFYNHQETMLKTAGAKAVFNDYRQLANFLGLPKMV